MPRPGKARLVSSMQRIDPTIFLRTRRRIKRLPTEPGRVGRGGRHPNAAMRLPAEAALYRGPPIRGFSASASPRPWAWIRAPAPGLTGSSSSRRASKEPSSLPIRERSLFGGRLGGRGGERGGFLDVLLGVELELAAAAGAADRIGSALVCDRHGGGTAGQDGTSGGPGRRRPRRTPRPACRDSRRSGGRTGARRPACDRPRPCSESRSRGAGS